MSCNNCQSVTPCNCSSDPCNPNNNTGCEHVIYTGPALQCSTIAPGDTMCVALQKIDNILCNPSSATVTASNGLYKDLFTNDIRMGGPLTEVTTIGTSNLNTLSLTGLVSSLNPLYILVQTNLGVVRKTLTSVLTANILSQITADNGITYTPNNIQLGGPLVKVTTITATSTNTLAIAGLVNDPSATYVVTINNSTGVLTKTAVSAIVPTITADNGLTKTVNNIQLGGTLIKPTTVTADPTNTITLAGLQANTTPTYLLSQNGSDVTTRTLTSTFISGILSQITADNGLTKNGNIIELGGTLNRYTFVELSGNSLYLKDTTLTGTGIGIIPGTDSSSNPNWGLNVTEAYGKFRAYGYAAFNENVGIGTDPNPSPFGPLNSDVRLSVLKFAKAQNSPICATTNSTLYFAQTDTWNIPNTSQYAGLFGSLFFDLNGTQTFKPGTDFAAIIGYPLFVSMYDVTDLTIKGVIGQCYFSKNNGNPGANMLGNSKVIAIAGKAPIPYQGGNASTSGWGGNIPKAIGLWIENQRISMCGGCTTASGGPTGTITNSYGIVQGLETDKTQGQDDKNVFNAIQNIFPNIPLYTNDAAATADTNLPSGSLYRINADVRAIRWKP